ncbi:MAG: gliding motility-associated C-terminal domain-containing protein [Candidatus Latescibacterota bacterium]|nr:gliding motility-associated C-terminal domain-containing protein [Candidatus Latescibacterota bacterium]
MATRCAHLFVFALSAFVTLAPASALTIYRVGSSVAPSPDLEMPHEFVYLGDWSSVEAARHGLMNQLTPESGRIRPRTLEAGVNLAPLIEEQGGQIFILEWTGWQPYEEEDRFVWDGDPNTAYLGDGHYLRAVGYGPQMKYYIFDFGGLFRIDRVRIYPREAHRGDRFIERFLIGTNDGNPLKDGTRDLRVIWFFGASLRDTGWDFNVVHDVDENIEPTLDLEIPPQPIRYLYFQAPENRRGIWEIAEFEIYGTGFAHAADYVSNVIDLGSPASIGHISWSGLRDEGAEVEISARAGGDDDPNNYWRNTFRGDEQSRFDKQGVPLTRTTYRQLESIERAGITHDTENWDSWSPPFDFGLGQSDLDTGRAQRYVQIRADFTSNANATGELAYLQFSASIPPAVSEAVAEIVPAIAAAGKIIDFTYKIRPRVIASDGGFDAIAVDTPSRPQSVDEVRVSGQPVAFEVMQIDNGGWRVKIPRMDVQNTGELVEVDFRTEVFNFGTEFRGRLFDSERPHEVPHPVIGGDADQRAEGNGIRVDLDRASGTRLSVIGLSTPVVTPNGDGVHDVVNLEYQLINFAGAASFELRVHDLGGRIVSQQHNTVSLGGRFHAQWDGRDGEDTVVPPGIYLMTVEVDTDAVKDTAHRTITVAY